MTRKLFGYDTGKPHTTEIVKSILAPYNGELLPVKEFNGTLPDGLIVVSGILRGTGLVFKECVSQHHDFLFVDHAYFIKGYDSPNWMRVTRNRHVFGPTLTGNSSERFDKHFSQYTIGPWKGGQGDYVLVMPPTDAIGWLFDARSWEEETIAKLKTLTDRPIRVRGKPNNPIVDDKGNLLRMESDSSNGPSLAEDLSNAYAAVIYNSNAAIDCLRAGVPVICEEACAAYPISFRYTDLDTDALRIEPQRHQLFWDLANAQFTREEMRMGKLPEALLGKP